MLLQNASGDGKDDADRTFEIASCSLHSAHFLHNELLFLQAAKQTNLTRKSSVVYANR
jgi:hypothetical protein